VIARIVRWRANDVLRVPLSALFRHEGEWALFKVVGGRARLTKIKVGHLNTEWAEILSGLAAGDRLVLHPSVSVIDGTRIIGRASR
jgi:HlyD family secretion protein